MVDAKGLWLVTEIIAAMPLLVPAVLGWKVIYDQCPRLAQAWPLFVCLKRCDTIMNQFIDRGKTRHQRSEFGSYVYMLEAEHQE
jgi:hypothetical protein